MSRMKTLTVNPDLCTSCRMCELACSAKHSGEFRPSRAHVHVAVFVDDAVYIPMVCMQCADAPCMRVCPSGALARDPETNAVVVHEERCIGCRLCVMACPFGAIRYWNGLARKCDLCGGDPECVRVCNGALGFDFEERDGAAARRAYAQRLRHTLKEVTA